MNFDEVLLYARELSIMTNKPVYLSDPTNTGNWCASQVIAADDPQIIIDGETGVSIFCDRCGLLPKP